MRITKTELVTVTLALLFVLLAGSAGYVVIEGWGWLDAFYMTVITLATIGYGEIHPLSPHGRIFTICLIFSGLGLMAYAFSAFTAAWIGGYLTDAFRRRKMESRIRALNAHYIVCGASRTGLSIMEELRKTGRPFVMVDSSPETAKTLSDKGMLVVTGDATEDKTLKDAGVERARGIFCCVNNDKDNAFVALTARLLNSSVRIISTQRSEDVRQKLMKSGADVVINPGHIGGLRMVSEMVRPVTVSFLDAMLREEKSDYRFEDVAVKRAMKLGALKGAQGGAALVVAARGKEEKAFDMNPSPERMLGDGDHVVALGSTAQIKELHAALGDVQ